MIIGLTGTNGSGKGTVAKFLKEKGFRYYSLSDELRRLMKEDSIEITLPNLIAWGNKIRETYGPNYLAKRVVKKIKKEQEKGTTNFIVDSIRNPHELEEVKKLDGFKMLAVDADLKIRYDRVQARAREDDKQTFEEFKHNEEVQMQTKDETKQQLKVVMDNADVKLMNNGTIEELKAELEKALS